jgi:uncharacterized membrane protein YoaK (UPF0700 family)
MNSSSSLNRYPKLLIALESLLLIPLIGSLFSSEVQWSGADYLIMGVLLFLLGSMIELVLRRTQKQSSRLLLIGISLLIFLLIWAELAVGIFGSP